VNRSEYSSLMEFPWRDWGCGLWSAVCARDGLPLADADAASLAGGGFGGLGFALYLTYVEGYC